MTRNDRTQHLILLFELPDLSFQRGDSPFLLSKLRRFDRQGSVRSHLLSSIAFVSSS